MSTLCASPGHDSTPISAWHPKPPRSSFPLTTKPPPLATSSQAFERPPAGTRSWSSTTDRPTAPASVARAAGAVVIRHPYRKGNGAAVKTRHPARDRRVHPDHRRRRTAPGGRCRQARRAASANTTSSSARGPRATQATQSRRFGNAALNRLASYLADHPIPDLTSGFRAARRATARQSSCTCCRTASRRRRRRRWRSSRRATTSRSSRSTRGRASASRRSAS